MASTSAMITDEELERVRSRIGEVIEIAEPPYLTEANRDAIRRWAKATGDRNQLYLDEDYARDSVHGTMIAPPAILYAFSRTSIGYRGGLPGVHSFFAGSHWRWFEPIKSGTSIRPETQFKDLIELKSRFAGRMFKQLSLTRFMDEGDNVLAEVEGWGMRTERQTAREKGKYGGTELASYTPDDIKQIALQYQQEVPRGRDTLSWDDVEVGASVPDIIRGPYTATTAVAFEQAWGGLFVRAHGYWFDFLAEHPAAGIANAYGIPEPPEAVHWDTQLAQSVGVPEAYDYGPERIAWLTTMLTNWIGDDGFLEELYCEIRRFNLIGDITYCHGEVEEKLPSDQDGNGRVRVRIWATNQREETTAKGWAIVRLPSN